ncbi:hypothetical protein L1987_56873 [Smallanthus sonchifolius]|uniref:Uncharacterized protein n=1 Tax=Smallanthus sonchifolius TaxID=185202 RepID=A0ACB9DBD0_9ASTR|nr:hypothetical protein L1987_56873 [Smallanthus sonchifolius]
MLDLLLECKDDEGKKLDKEEIFDTLIGYLNAGHESSAHLTTWATMFLQTHPEDFKKAKEEQERIVKNRPSGQKGLTLKEYRQMEYLSKVVDETLRIVSLSFMTFLEAKKDVDFKEVEHIMEALEKEFTTINHGFRAICINIPGFAYHEAFKARRRLITTLDGIIKERKKKQETSQGITRNDMLDLLLECEDDEGKKLDNEEIIDTLIGYLNAGHESSAHVTTWATMFFQTHPEDFKKAKVIKSGNADGLLV